MVIGTLTEIERYEKLHPCLKKAVEFLSEHPSLGAGVYPIIGEDLYLTVSEGAMRTKEEAPLEAHDRYIYVQLPIQGTETYGWSPRSRCRTPRGAFDRQKDIVFFEDRPESYVTLQPGDFVIFFPEDAHAPLIGTGTIKKAILKMRVLSM